MRLRGVITYVGSPEAKARGFAASLRDANFETVHYWWRTYVPGHFTVAGGKRYGYQPRRGDDEGPTLQKQFFDRASGKVLTRTVANWHYSWAKRKRKRHNRPLVWSGASEAAALSQFKITATRKGARGVFSGLPRYFYMYRKAAGGRVTPDKAAELIATTPAELRDLARVHQAVMTDRLNAIRTAHSKRVA